jgi:hypothetical protein
MPRYFRWTIWLAASSLCACGGGGGGNDTAAAGVALPGGATTGAAANMVSVTVGPGPSAASSSFNIPYVSVTVCVTGSSNCVTLNHVLVDTGSTGLRLMASALAGLPLVSQSDPSINGNVMAECLPFADGYTWGTVATASIKIGGETASAVPVQIIDDDSSFSPTVPASCTSNGASLNSIDAFSANGILGVGLFSQDCGSYCAQSTGNLDWYYSCTQSHCSTTTQALDRQVDNPVTLFAVDNNGVILELPAIPASGATSASGYLVFGIGTQSNNSLGSAIVLSVEPYTGQFTTSFEGHSLNGSFLDSGSNGFFFVDASITNCPSSVGAQFYCPSSSLDLTATDQGANGNTSAVSFQVASLSQLSSANFARNDVAGSGSSIAGLGSDYFDWGLPFFYGRSVYVAIEGLAAGSATGPYFAF